MNRLLLLLTFVLMATVSACNEDAVEKLYFIGDSLVERWDLQESFPSLITQNDGVAGSRIDYVEGLAGRYKGQTVVVLIGTNDIGHVGQDEMTGYADRYIKAITSLGATKIYLLSVPPRNAMGDHSGVNKKIVELNSLVKKLVTSYPQIVYIDIYTPLLRDGVLNEEYSFDGLHLNDYGYEVVTKCIFDKL